jgi:hypothetical protein
LGHTVCYNFTDVSEVLAASIIGVLIEAVGTYETSVNFYPFTWNNNPKDSHLHHRRLENLKSHSMNFLIVLMRM